MMQFLQWYSSRQCYLSNQSLIIHITPFYYNSRNDFDVYKRGYTYREYIIKRSLTVGTIYLYSNIVAEQQQTNNFLTQKELGLLEIEYSRAAKYKNTSK